VAVAAADFTAVVEAGSTAAVGFTAEVDSTAEDSAAAPV
jgi:hypothetical protein